MKKFALPLVIHKVYYNPKNQTTSFLIGPIFLLDEIIEFTPNTVREIYSLLLSSRYYKQLGTKYLYIENWISKKEHDYLYEANLNIEKKFMNYPLHRPVKLDNRTEFDEYLNLIAYRNLKRYIYLNDYNIRSSFFVCRVIRAKCVTRYHIPRGWPNDLYGRPLCLDGNLVK